VIFHETGRLKSNPAYRDPGAYFFKTFLERINEKHALHEII